MIPCNDCVIKQEDMFLYPTVCFTVGLFSSTMRELTSGGHDGPKWIVLDGDIDPMWIESLNTVMDDNKVQLFSHTVLCFQSSTAEFCPSL